MSLMLQQTWQSHHDHRQWQCYSNTKLCICCPLKLYITRD